jgi:hypothetical protein
MLGNVTAIGEKVAIAGFLDHPEEQSGVSISVGSQPPSSVGVAKQVNWLSN